MTDQAPLVAGGGVMSAQPHLFSKIRRALAASLNNHVADPRLAEGLDEHVTRPGFADAAGPYGAIALGFDALDRPAAASRAVA